MRLDAVYAVAIGANRRARNATGYRYSMNALVIFPLDLRVTLAAGGGDGRLEDRGISIRRRQYVVAIMAVGANRGIGVASRNSARVNALLIRDERAVANARPGHSRSVTMTGAAGLCQVGPVDCGSRVAGRQNGCHVAAHRMTIETICCLPPVLDCSPVESAIVGFMCAGMKESAP